jgi:excisionase family DNA binding protein
VTDCHPETIRRAIRSGRMACYQLGGMIRISPDQLETLIQSTLRPAKDETSVEAKNTKEVLREFRFNRRIDKALRR